MLTASSRTCAGCGRLLPVPPAAAACTHCGRVAAPLHTTWPAGFKKWLLMKWLEGFWAPYAAFTEQYRWERLLIAVIAGRTWSGRIIPYATYAEDCYLVAMQEFTAESAPKRSTTTEAA